MIHNPAAFPTGAMAAPPRRHFPVLFLSDLHLGSRACRADALLDFLHSHSADTIYLVGDILDTWTAVGAHWTDTQHAILQLLLDRARQGVRLVFTPGNHDAVFRRYNGQHLAGIEVVPHIIHHAADGRRYLVIHGDSRDDFSERFATLALFGARIDVRLRGAMSRLNRLLRRLDYPTFEVLFCVASPNDPALPLLHRLIAAHPAIAARILIGADKISGNPKLNNCAKGWRAAAHPFVLMADSNVLLPPDCLTRLLERWTPDTGLVSSPPIGVEPAGFWARLECAFLNTFQARWQLAADRTGHGFAQGKMLFWQRDLLERAGGIAVLGQEMAEDVAATKVVRATGLKVRLPARLFAQPTGPRSFAAVEGSVAQID